MYFASHSEDTKRIELTYAKSCELTLLIKLLIVPLLSVILEYGTETLKILRTPSPMFLFVIYSTYLSVELAIYDNPNLVPKFRSISIIRYYVFILSILNISMYKYPLY